MKTHCRKTAPILLLAGLGIMCCLKGCAPGRMSPEHSLTSPQYHVQGGMKFLGLHKYDDAQREFELGKELDPVFSKAYVGSGLAWAYKNNPERGLKDINKAKDLANTDEEKVFASVGLIRLYMMGKESAHKHWLGEAESAFRDAVALWPESAEANYYMGQAYKEASDFKKARRLFKKVLQINNAYVREASRALNLMDSRHKQGRP